MEIKEAIGLGIVLGVTSHTMKSLSKLNKKKKKKKCTKRRKKK